MNLVGFEVNSLKYRYRSYNLSISKKTMKINNTRAFFKGENIILKQNNM